MVETPVLSARGVVKCYSDGRHPIEVLSRLNLTIMSGDWLAIVGASGSGKSTLLNLLGGLDAPDAGEVVVSGRLLADMSERERSLWRNRNLGFVFQMHHLLPEFSALENVAMPARIGGLAKADAEERALHLLDQLSLSARATHRPAALSGGERQRVAIARALVNEPSCVLMDEPTGNLDPATAEHVLLAMQAFRRYETAFVVVTHDPDIANRMDRKLTLASGRLEGQ